ncbi:MAG: arsenic efflux protein, partial [Candidatus Nealsonbacteria bacterium]|nr:arsenic efflux protein [Candidatus Nealsonbacteria bacterium]
AGSFPQCGFSVVTTALYTQRLVTIGTLLSVYVATSDEAIPIILSQPDKINIIFPLILTKIFIALIAGCSVDFLFRKNNEKTLAHIEAYSHGRDEKDHNHGSVTDEKACCGHSTSPVAKRFNSKEIFVHPIIHTIKIFFFIFVVSLLINFAVYQIGEEQLAKFLLNHNFLQPFFAALIGLIPNCAASVAITGLYLKGLITYGSVVAGLCASAGLGILILFREEKDKKNVFTIISLLFGISVLAGLVIQYFF